MATRGGIAAGSTFQRILEQIRWDKEVKTICFCGFAKKVDTIRVYSHWKGGDFSEI